MDMHCPGYVMWLLLLGAALVLPMHELAVLAGYTHRPLYICQPLWNISLMCHDLES
jgi:hypothetical protein